MVQGKSEMKLGISFDSGDFSDVVDTRFIFVSPFSKDIPELNWTCYSCVCLCIIWAYPTDEVIFMKSYSTLWYGCLVPSLDDRGLELEDVV